MSKCLNITGNVSVVLLRAKLHSEMLCGHGESLTLQQQSLYCVDVISSVEKLTSFLVALRKLSGKSLCCVCQVSAWH